MTASSSSSWLLQTKNLAVTYQNGHQALLPTSLTIRPGEFLVLLGASGAGKSTLLRSLNSLVKPTAGELLLNDIDQPLSGGKALREHRRRTGMVFQQHHLIGRQTVLANVLMGLLATRSSLQSLLPWSKEDKHLALSAIDRVGLIEKALTRADALSGGQQQRVGIARALIQQPRLMLADEPVASLDPHTAESVLQLLHDICKTDHLTAVVSLHQIDFAKRFADRIVGLSQGKVVFDGKPGALTEADIQRLYTGGVSQDASESNLDIPALCAA
ncbi:phosphonate ABC transporter ATP-binding protein [Advenella sp. WQ 585]|uniref:Phosphonate ABC transporter ATP-binding protein n=1 Tax=Advenella mandrilli TaxID=2800330 RepID=A0ABS1EHZ5_9BURK|nr:phosphonate ABC transporter ATP-binding protein [Advenella mandrilli]MBK1782632.1 phosphonate ABC transporter ATP-binding protein [Advenella mandrilli]